MQVPKKDEKLPLEDESDSDWSDEEGSDVASPGTDVLGDNNQPCTLEAVATVVSMPPSTATSVQQQPRPEPSHDEESSWSDTESESEIKPQPALTSPTTDDSPEAKQPQHSIPPVPAAQTPLKSSADIHDILGLDASDVDDMADGNKSDSLPWSDSDSNTSVKVSAQ